MTERQIQLVRQSFRQLAPTADRAAELFYSRLFTLRPDLRALFTHDLELQRRKFLYTIEHLVKALDRLEVLLPEAAELGHRHIQYGVLNTHYEVVGEALIGALREELSGYFDAEVEQAWQDLYALVGKAMRGEEIPPIPISNR